MTQMTEQLALRLKQQPQDAQGWNMLGRSYLALGRLPEALKAHAEAVSQDPNNPDLLADHADALAVANGRRLGPDAEALVARALSLQPTHLKSLVLSAAAARDRGDHARAARLWDQVASIAPTDTTLPAQARQAAELARQQIGQGVGQGTGEGTRQGVAQAAGQPLRPAAPGAALNSSPGAALNSSPSAASNSSPSAASNSSPGAASNSAPAAASTNAPGAVSGTVRLSPALAAAAQPNDTVFVVARPAAGGRMPLAVLKVRVADLPYRFRLDDSQAMTPAALLSTAGAVVVSARVSRSGQAIGQSGDLESAAIPAQPGAASAQGLDLLIDQRRP
jgi:cytochrome c-type biogenesis protein CcmH